MASALNSPAPLLLIWGEDDFAVQQRAKQVYEEWREEVGGFDHEVIDAAAGNSGEALKAVARLREALQTLPFFGSGKVIWFKQCGFLGDDRTSESQAVTQALTDLAGELKAFTWGGVRLLISAGKVDRRKALYKTIERIGTVELPAGLSADTRDWADQAEAFVRRELKARRQSITDDAGAELVAAVGPNLRALQSEVEKLSIYAGDTTQITAAEVAAVVSRGKHARAFGLAEALGDRDLPRALRELDAELWEMRSDRSRSAISLLYSLIAKVRVLLLLKEMVTAGWVRPDGDYARFKAQLGELPTGVLPADKRYNPALMHPFTLFKALPQTRRYQQAELVRAMEWLLDCNRRLVSSGLDEALLIQRALVGIISPASP